MNERIEESIQLAKMNEFRQKFRQADILLVDDIYTTGSTANAIAGKLKAVGVKNVYVLTLCIGKGI